MQNKLVTIFISSLMLSFFMIACKNKKQSTAIINDAVIVRTQPVTTAEYASAMQYSGKLNQQAKRIYLSRLVALFQEFM